MEQGGRWYARPDWWLVSANVAAIVIAALAAVVFWGQLRVMRETLAEMRSEGVYTRMMAKAADGEAQASAKAAGAAVESVRAASTSLHLGERAWVGLGPGRAVLAKAEPLKVTIEIDNSGRTPADQVSTGIMLTVLPRGTRFPTTRLELPGASFKQMAPEPPQGHQQFQGTFNWRPEEFEAATSGRYVAYIHGVIRYQDIFGMHHYTNFCLIVNKSDAASLLYCPFGNTMN